MLKNITNKQLAIGFAILTCAVVLYEFATKPNEVSVVEKNMDSVDTLIPQGMTLVPIEILNSTSLSELIGSHGVVDLYEPSTDSSTRPKKIVAGVKIMRAPLNPNVYAVLVKDEDAPQIARNTSGYFVTVQNPKTQKFNFEKAKIKKQSHIISEI